MSDKSKRSTRIAKNTGIMYFRMIFLMLITLYTSRVILEALGVEDYGVYNVVGGFVAMFSVLSKALTSASTRFINFEMGKGNFERLKKVFSTSLTIQLFLVVAIVIVCEAIGVWYVNNVMVIVPERLNAANWTFQFSVITFCSHLIVVPYNAAIIAHERMTAFAYVSLFEGTSKLAICFAVMVSPIDTLIFYAALICFLQITIQSIYIGYCCKKFEECKSKLCFNKQMISEMFGYAGWTFIGTSASILRNQGGNILINLFFGPVVNAARGVANQVLQAVSGFVTNFTLALDPQITQSYAKGDYDYLMKLVYIGSRMSYYMLLFLCLPIIINADFILHIWLKDVPNHAVVFTQLTLVFTMVESLSHTFIKAQQATGKVRNYQLVVGGLNLLNLPLSYFAYRLGAIEEAFLYIAIVIAIVTLFARVIMLRTYVNLNVVDFSRNVLLKILVVTALAIVLPLLMSIYMPSSPQWVISNIIVSILMSSVTILFIGCSSSERQIVYNYTNIIIKKLKK